MRKLLANARVYSGFAALVGGRARATYAQQYIRARHHDRILDLGCGPGDILHHLPAGVRYTGVDASAVYISDARRRFAGRGEFVCDTLGPGLVGRYLGFDLVLANGVLHHLDEREARALFEIARTALAPQGRLVTIDGCYVDGQSAVSRYLLNRDRGQYVRDQEGYLALARASFPVVTAHLRHDLMRIPYTHLILECAA